MGFVGCKGKPFEVGDDLEQLPSAHELHKNIVKLPEKVARKLLGFKQRKVGNVVLWEKDNDGRVTIDGTKVLIDGEFVYDRRTGGKGL